MIVSLLILYIIFKIRLVIGVGLFIIVHRTNFPMFVNTLLSIMFIGIMFFNDNQTLVCVEIVYLDISDLLLHIYSK